MGLENCHRFSALDQQRFVLFQVLKRFKDRIEAFPVAGSLTTPPINHQFFRTFSHFRVKVVLDHAEWRFS